MWNFKISHSKIRIAFRTNMLQNSMFHDNIIMLFFLVSLFNLVGLVTDWQGRVHVVNTQKRYCD